jgi:hypothetical protein
VGMAQIALSWDGCFGENRECCLTRTLQGISPGRSPGFASVGEPHCWGSTLGRSTSLHRSPLRLTLCDKTS